MVGTTAPSKPGLSSFKRARHGLHLLGRRQGGHDTLPGRRRRRTRRAAFAVGRRRLLADPHDLPAVLRDGDQLLAARACRPCWPRPCSCPGFRRISLAPAPVMTMSDPSILTLTPGSSTSTTSVPSGENRRMTVPWKSVTPVASVKPRPPKSTRARPRRPPSGGAERGAGSPARAPGLRRQLARRLHRRRRDLRERRDCPGRCSSARPRASRSATSWAEAKRSSGFLACSLAMMSHSHCGTSGMISRIGRGVSSATRLRTASVLLARNGGRPVAHRVEHAAEAEQVGPLVERARRAPAPGPCTSACRR